MKIIWGLINLSLFFYSFNYQGNNCSNEELTEIQKTAYLLAKDSVNDMLRRAYAKDNDIQLKELNKLLENSIEDWGTINSHETLLSNLRNYLKPNNYVDHFHKNTYIDLSGDLPWSNFLKIDEETNKGKQLIKLLEFIPILLIIEDYNTYPQFNI